MNRYTRQYSLPMVGEVGQRRLLQSHVLVVGAGALGCPVLQYCVGAGVGHITLVDPDVVTIDNLHRQPLYDEKCVGQPKALIAASRLTSLNSDVRIMPHIQAFDPCRAVDWVTEADVVLDCADSFAVTYSASDECWRQKKAYISASVLGVNGYVGGFCHGAPSVRAIFPQPPRDKRTCESAGVMGPVAATVGCIQAQMALSYLLGTTPSPLGQMVVIDFANYGFRHFRFDGAHEPEGKLFHFIARSQLVSDDLIIDLRTEKEVSESPLPEAQPFTLQDLIPLLPTLEPSQRLVLCCRRGMRAWHAALDLAALWAGPIALLALNG